MWKFRDECKKAIESYSWNITEEDKKAFWFVEKIDWLETMEEVVIQCNEIIHKFSSVTKKQAEELIDIFIDRGCVYEMKRLAAYLYHCSLETKLRCSLLISIKLDEMRESAKMEWSELMPLSID